MGSVLATAGGAGNVIYRVVGISLVVGGVVGVVVCAGVENGLSGVGAEVGEDVGGINSLDLQFNQSPNGGKIVI